MPSNVAASNADKTIEYGCLNSIVSRKIRRNAVVLSPSALGLCRSALASYAVRSLAVVFIQIDLYIDRASHKHGKYSLVAPAPAAAVGAAAFPAVYRVSPQTISPLLASVQLASYSSS
jgi:hypothetical protein